MGKAFIFFTSALLVFTPALMAGCGREGGAAREEKGDSVFPAVREPGIPAPADIPVYPGAEEMEAEMLAGFEEQGFNVSVYKTSDSLSRVYSFYSGALEEMGFDAPGSVSIGNGSHFVFRVSLAGREVAVVNGGVEEGNTIISVVRPE